MIFESYAAFRSSSFVAAVAVIGSGPAGITIARKLAAAGINVAVLEAGAKAFTADSQSFYEGRVTGDPYFALAETRLRYFGGASNHWAGWCRVLDEMDFVTKPWVADTGWPITRRDLEPYLDEVREILGLPAFDPDEPVSRDIRRVQLIKSQARRFAEYYQDEIERSDRIALVLDAYVTSLDGDGASITALNMWSQGAAQGKLIVRHVVVATGGLENSRLLLWSNELTNNAVVPNPAALGRYWMEHPHFEAGNAIFANPDWIKPDETGEAFFSPTWEAMERKSILNFGIRVVQMPYQGVKELVANLACTAPNAAEWLSDGMGEKLRCAAQMHVSWEQAPLASNRVVLDHENRDATGVPRIDLRWKKSPLERRTVAESMRLFGEMLAANDLGRLRMADWLAKGEPYPDDAEIGGNHHMGGTRMSSDPSRGVVDANCKVHGMRNLYVGGSSVFATSGQCPPTTTITALACRLGDHLATIVKSDRSSQ